MKLTELVLIFLALYLPVASKSQAMVEIPLYKTNTGIYSEKIEVDDDGNIKYISGEVNPRLLLYRPDSVNGTAIVICPGSGYARLNIENTRFIAQRLNKLGITVFILAHRLPKFMDGKGRSTAVFEDVQTALFYVRKNATKFGLSIDKIGPWGSSAGGHLAAMTATHYSNIDFAIYDTKSIRPDFVVLAWPVISFRPGLVHAGSMKNLLGDSPSDTQIEYYSADEWVNGNTPMTFLVHASDDNTVPFENSIRYFKALKKYHIDTELHIYEKGGHNAFGLAPSVTDKESWITQLEIWLRNHGFIN
jgi:acetyl esterase/lipase